MLRASDTPVQEAKMSKSDHATHGSATETELGVLLKDRNLLAGDTAEAVASQEKEKEEAAGGGEGGGGGEGEQKRDQWTRQLDFILSLVGYTVGVGNLWRFPYVCNRNGGGAFLIPFVVCLFVCGAPVIMLEMTVGQFSGKGAIQVWDICPLFRGLGWASNIVSAWCCWYFIMLLAWPIYYIVVSMATSLPYATCGNPWNTPDCLSRHLTALNGTPNATMTTHSGSAIFQEYNVTSFAENVTTGFAGDVSGLGINWTATSSRGGAPATPFEEYWRYQVLRLSPGLEELGQVQWEVTLCLLAAWLLVALCLIRGVKSLGKVVYVTAVVPYFLLTVLLIRTLMLDGAVDGVVYYLKPDFSKLLEPKVWVEAAVQVFYSLGPGWGGIITMSSYSRFKNNLLRDALVLPLVSEGTSLYGGLVVFSVLGFMAKSFNVPISEVVTSGPGLGMVVYPEALAVLPLPQLWAVLFFLMVLLVGMDTQFTMVETIITTLVDAFPRRLGNRRMSLTLAFCILFVFLSLPFVCNGGMYLYILVDWYMAALGLFVVAILECLIVGWIYGGERVMRDMELMLGKRPPAIIKWTWCVVTPLVLLGILLMTMAGYPAPTYGTYEFPAWGQALGWLIAVSSILPIPILAVWEVFRRQGPLLQRLRDSLKPTRQWLPQSVEHREMYAAKFYPAQPCPSSLPPCLACPSPSRS